MIAALPWPTWAGVGLALVLFFSPGAGLTLAWAGRRPLGLLPGAALTVALAGAFWPCLLVLLYPFGVRLEAFSVRGLAGLALAGALGLAWRRRTAWRRPALAEAGILAVAGLAGLLGLWSLRTVVAGLGSDSYHHTLITQLILDRGGVPKDYAPYAPLVSFSYHFGSHADTAVFAWLTGLPARLALPIFGQVNEAAAVLSVAALTHWLTGRTRPALAAAGVVGLISVFPAYYINWSRYPQLAGLVVLPVFLGLAGQWLDGEQDWRTVGLLGFLAGGLTLIHYRVVLMTAVGALVIGAAWWLARRPAARALAATLLKLAAAAGLALALAIPWVWQVRTGLARGFPVALSEPLPTAFSLERLGPRALAYPTNVFLVLLVLAAVGWGLWRRERVVLTMTAWAAGLWAASGPQVAGGYMDTLSVFISLYIPAGVCLGWAVDGWAEAPGRWRPLVRAGLAVSLGAAAMAGAWALAHVADLSEAYVGPDDLSAAAWIRANTPAEARFWVNVFAFEFRPDYVVGSDAGAWLPLLAGRAAAALPMTYPIERVAAGTEPAELVTVLQASQAPDNPATLAALRAAGLGYVYLGQRGGPLSGQEAALLASPAYEVLYRLGTTLVLRLR